MNAQKGSIVFANAILLFAQNMYAYIQSELEEFKDIYDDNTVDELHADPSYIAIIKGEDPAPSVLKNVKNVKSRKLKKSARDTKDIKVYKGQLSTSSCKKRNKQKIDKKQLRMAPPPVEELVLRKDCFIATEKTASSSTELPRQIDSGINISGTLAGDGPSSAAKDSKTLPVSGKSAERSKHSFLPSFVNVAINSLVDAVQNLCDYVRQDLKNFNDIYEEDAPEVLYLEPALIACIKGEDTCTDRYISRRHVRYLDENLSS